VDPESKVSFSTVFGGEDVGSLMNFDIALNDILIPSDSNNCIIGVFPFSKFNPNFWTTGGQVILGSSTMKKHYFVFDSTTIDPLFYIPIVTAPPG
jgi:hypothetical protein